MSVLPIGEQEQLVPCAMICIVLLFACATKALAGRQAALLPPFHPNAHTSAKHGHGGPERGHCPHPSIMRCWHSVQVRMLFLANNSLTGPALPAAWAQPGGMLHLEILQLSGNTGLAGALPDTLAWPNLTTL